MGLYSKKVHLLSYQQIKELSTGVSLGKGAAVPYLEVGTDNFFEWSRDRTGPAIVGGGLNSYDLSLHSQENLHSSFGSQHVSSFSATRSEFRRSAVGTDFQT